VAKAEAKLARSNKGNQKHKSAQYRVEHFLMVKTSNGS